MAAFNENKDKEKELDRLTKELEDRFRRWDDLYQNGGSDPFWPDGMGLNMARGHIISYKRDIEKIVGEMDSEMSLFGTEYPDIYFKETPPEVPGDYMVKGDEIRQRAEEQLALYERDPNFLYCLENHCKIFANGETKATRAAGLSIWPTAAMGKYRKSVASGDLVAMRRDFHEPYEAKAVRWAEYAQAMKAFLEKDHSLDDNTPVRDTFDDEIDEIDALVDEIGDDLKSPQRMKVKEREQGILSLDEQIKNAKVKDTGREKSGVKREEQLSLF